MIDLNLMQFNFLYDIVWVKLFNQNIGKLFLVKQNL